MRQSIGQPDCVDKRLLDNWMPVMLGDWGAGWEPERFKDPQETVYKYDMNPLN